ncbi:tRNA glutamyl-Q(34) synthetase GluQRS [Acidocella sp.]|uniref:tRNA glutamyl-Q(34) synthetase GluQRS n=1 Tax=Acidocella sp. TaxID=50710 RepID=UPI00261C9F0C|nr:tRNA glutamyl-Q(34) synthetase GluQRS [Acidocella sp.]MDD2796295.1 tRNA glutamyl-Q(34) synthetase GluQRS [Acidocella sp.]
MNITTRFAPSPTGYLHLGHAFSAWNAWVRADVFRLRLEDIDSTRCRPEYAAAILEDLRWLGLEWDGEIRVQSTHLAQYQAALAILRGRGLLYPCFCTRAEIARAQAAPHGAEAVYPGTCRHLSEAARAERMNAGAAYALRLDMAAALRQAGALRFFEEGKGWIEARPLPFGDVVLARKDTPTSYHLCVVHDDALQGISHVIRGEDLFEATHVHVLLQALLGLPAPVYAHHRLLRDAQGRRLAKRDFAATLRSMRAAGVQPRAILRQFEEGIAA